MRAIFVPKTEKEHGTAGHRYDSESKDAYKHSIVDNRFGENQCDTDGAEEKHAVVFAHGIVDGPLKPRCQDELGEHGDDEN